MAGGSGHFSYGTNATACDLISDQREDGQRAEEDDPKPVPIARQQLFLLGDINRDLHGIGLSGTAYGSYGAGYNKQPAVLAIHAHGVLGAALGLGCQLR